jgi:general secretion pathway protein K
VNRTRPSASRRGVALIVVLWTITLLATIAALASSAARSTADVVSARRAGAIARAMAESGIALATARIDNALRDAPDSASRDAFLDELEGTGARGIALAIDTLNDGVFVVTASDVSARMDVNAAGREGWYLFLRSFVGESDARTISSRIDARVRGGGNSNSGNDEARLARDSLTARLLGREVAPGARRGIETLDELLEIPGIDAELLQRVAPMLTVDGNGTVNRRAASPAVLAAASGSLVDRPVRLLVVSRGWMRGHPLTREIEAVYDVASDGLRLVRWRERER